MSADVKQDIANEALRIVTGARRAAYGKPERNFERIALLWNAHLVNRGIIVGDTDALLPRDVAAFMRLMKEARLAETPDHRDSYVDLVGYALCGAEVAGVAVTEPGPTEQPEPAPLQIEAGKYYRTRDGRKVGPLTYHPDGEWVWLFGMDEWRADGSWAPYRGDTHDFDIVAEWTELDEALS